MTLGEKIREMRVKYDLTMEDLAEAAGLPKSYVIALENGYYQKPAMHKIKKIAAVLEVPIAYLMRDELTIKNVRKMMKAIKQLSVDDKKKLYRVVKLFLEST